MLEPVRIATRALTSVADAAARQALSWPLPTPARTARALLIDESARMLRGRTAVVTGGSSGIGLATAARFANAGAHVVLVARRAEQLEIAREQLEANGAEVETRVCDLADRDAATALGGALVADHPDIAVLVNNAGRSIRRPVMASVDRLHDFDRTMAVNYFGPVALSLAVLPAMVENGRGRIVNVSTWGTRMPSPLFAAYTASKAALDAFGRSTNVELAGTGVSIGSVHVPLVRTPMITPAQDVYRGTPSLSADEAARLVVAATLDRSGRVEPALVTLTHLSDTLLGGALERLMAGGQWTAVEPAPSRAVRA